MAAPPDEPKPKTVPKRSDTVPSGLIRNAGQSTLLGADPSFVYQNFSTDPESPGYIGKRLQKHFYGEGQVYGQWIGPWEVCHDLTDRDVRAMEARTDAGVPTDSVKRGPGRQITCRIPVKEHAKYLETDRANGNDREAELFRPDTVRSQHAAVTALVMQGEHDDISRTQALLAAGHPIPGTAGA